MRKKIVMLAVVVIVTFALTACSSSEQTPVIESVFYNETDIYTVITWSEVSDVSGYEILRASEENGTFDVIDTAGNNELSCTDDTIERNNTYYYKVRAYKSENGKNKYGDFSHPVKVIVWAPAETLEFEEQLAQANVKHSDELLEKSSFDGFLDFIKNEPEYQGLLTQDEITSLRDLSKKQTASISYDEAVSDVELLFRTLKYAYGAYFYFGGEEAFEQAEQDVMAELEGKNTVTTKNLQEYLKNSLSFVRDAHFGFNDTIMNDKSIRFEYLYCNVYFSEDENGYYKEINGRKWYYKSSENEQIIIAPTLTSEGELTYSPVLFCPITETDYSDDLILSDGVEEMKLSVKWIEQETIKSPGRVQDFKFAEADDIAYISIRNFSNDLDERIYKEYENTANKVKDCKLIIYDIRSNGGGSDEYCRNWTKNFTGTEPKLNSIRSDRYTALDKNRFAAPGTEKYTYEKSNGIVIENDIPVVILVDDICGSSGETALLFAKSMENAIVIGSNSSGYQLCGNVATYQLPNSAIYVNIPVAFQFNFKMENIDGKGYEPDVWCNPKTALEAVYNLIVKEGYAAEETVNRLIQEIENYKN